MTVTQARSIAKEADPYLKAFARFEQAGASRQPSWLFPLRKAGMARFAELGFPTLKQEDWRFTNVAPIAKLPFKPVFDARPHGLTKEALDRFAFAKLPGTRLVFVDGHYAPELATHGVLPEGVVVRSLAGALASDSALIEKHLGHYLRSEDDAFAALNNAFFQDGAFIHVPAGRIVEEPVQLLFVSTSDEAGAATHPRNLILTGPEAKLTVVEHYVNTVATPTLTNAVTEFGLGEHSVVEHCKFQDESPEAFHIGALPSRLGRGVNFLSHSIVVGAKLSRNNLRTILEGENIECVLNGIYLTRGEQLADHHMIVDHARPHCASHEYFNGILTGRSRGVFHGRILVRPDAQKTDAKQTNKNLLLSDDATVNTKPQLEIYADDVKCTHGATIGQLNDESIFYLRTRGISLETARRMLIHAFAGEIIDRVKHGALREELDELVWDRLEQQAAVAMGPSDRQP